MIGMTEPEWQVKTALVTGGGAGIGREICLALAAQGVAVLACDLDGEAARATVESIGESGGSALAAQGDVSRPTDVEAMFAMARRELGPLDLAVNNAGLSHPAVSILDLELEHLERIYQVDFKGVYLCCREAGREMTARGRGVVINISSIAGLVPLPLMAYGPMKAAVNMLTRVLAREWGPRSVRVNAVAPGYVMTPLIQGMIESGLRDPGLILERTPMNTMLSPQEVAQAVLFLCSPAARHISGVILPVDAGWTSDGGWSAYPGMGANR